MSNMIIDPTGDGNVNLSDGTPVSMQLIQQIYKEVTGKVEKLTKQYRINHKTDFQDLENLNFRIEQALEQYHVAEKACTVTLYHTDDSKERFSSFDRSRVYEAGSPSPVENVTIEYDFLIILPQAKKPQPYKISIGVVSRAAVLSRKDQFDTRRSIIYTIGSITGMVSVDYVDYAVARNFMATINQWFDSLPQENDSSALMAAKKFSHHFYWIARNLSAAICAYALYRALSAQAIAATAILPNAVLAFSLIYITTGIASQFGRSLENFIDFKQSCSYLKLNRGDERVISEIGSSNMRAMLGASAALVGAVIVNIIAAWIAAKIGVSS